MDIEEEGDRIVGQDLENEVSESDREMAREIANFIAARAFEFEDHECRAWALTDFGVWATLAGDEPKLQLVEGSQG